MANNERTQKKASIKRATAVAQRDTTKLDKRSLNELKSLYKAALGDISEELKAAADSQNVIRLERLAQLKNTMESRLSTLQSVKKKLLDNMMQESARLGVGPLEKHIGVTQASGAMDQALLSARTFTGSDGLQLSDRLWIVNDDTRNIVNRSVQQAVIRGYDASSAAADFLERGMPVPGDLQKTINQANPEAISRTIGQKLLRDDDSAYQNARRLFRTEINRAHGLAYQNAAFEDDDVIGTKFVLSPNHRHRDICDMHASVNRFGLGRGVYPQGKSPWPAHPNTLSYEEAVFSDEVEDEDRDGKEDRISWLRQQSYDEQLAVLKSRMKVEALNKGVLTEQQITTPWKVLKQRYERKGIDLDKLPVIQPPVRPSAAASEKAAGSVTRGVPVSNAINAKGYKSVADRTLAAIDQVHGDGRLPAIPVKHSKSKSYNGVYRHYINSGKPIDIKISSHGGQKELTLAHELGHFIDHQGVGTVGTFASANDRRFESWRKAVGNSEAIQQLVGMFDGPGSVQGYSVSKKHIHYLLKTHEIWARSYAQYIAQKSGDAVMLQQLKKMQGLKDKAIVYYPYQWSDEDFKPIADVIDELFKELGWINGN